MRKQRLAAPALLASVLVTGGCDWLMFEGGAVRPATEANAEQLTEAQVATVDRYCELDVETDWRAVDCDLLKDVLNAGTVGMRSDFVELVDLVMDGDSPPTTVEAFQTAVFDIDDDYFDTDVPRDSQRYNALLVESMQFTMDIYETRMGRNKVRTGRDPSLAIGDD